MTADAELRDKLRKIEALFAGAATPDRAGSITKQLVAMLHLGYYPANHQQEFPEVVRVEHAASYLDAAEPFIPVIESIDEAMLRGA